MSNIEFFENSMTIFYSKSTGKLKNLAGGKQDWSMFGVDQDDYKIIWDFIVVDYNKDVFDNTNKYVVDPKTKVLIDTTDDGMKEKIGSIDTSVNELNDQVLMAYQAMAEIYEDNLKLKEEIKTMKDDAISTMEAIAEIYENLLELMEGK